MHHFESMPSLHLPSPDDTFPSSPPASPLSFTSVPSIAGKRSRGHTHRRSLAISSSIMLPPPSIFDQNPALITPPLSSPALSFPKTASLESLRSGNTMLDYDSDLPRTPNVDDVSLRGQPSVDALPDQMEVIEDKTTSDVNDPMPTATDMCDVCSDTELPSKLRKVTFNNAITYYPPRPQSSRQASFSSQISQPSSRETTPSVPSPSRIGHRKSLSSFLLPSPAFRPSTPSTAHCHTRERRSWAGLITSPFTAARRLRSPNRYRPPTPPLGHDADDEAEEEMWQPPAPIIDLDAALGPFQTPSSPSTSNHSGKFWALTSHVGTHRRSESAPEIRGLGFNTYFSSETTLVDDSSAARGLKRKMSVIDEEDRVGFHQPEEDDDEDMDVDGLQEMISREEREMGEMGDLVINESTYAGDSKLSKRPSWRKSLKDWWKKV